MVTMREIKYRVWNTTYKRMGKLLELVWRTPYQEPKCIADFGEIKPELRLLRAVFPEDDKHILMQYTGLKDKNGKEIYEGDIICIMEDVVVETIGGYPRTEPEGKIRYVEFHTGSWVYVNPQDKVDSSFLNFFDGHIYEVIGNIYENPELLK